MLNKKGIIKLIIFLSGFAICSTTFALKLKLECDVSVIKFVSGRVIQSTRDVVLINVGDYQPHKFIETHGAFEIMMGTHTLIDGKGTVRDSNINDLSDSTKWHLIRNSGELTDSLLIDRSTGRISYKSNYQMLRDEVSGVCRQVDAQKMKF